MDVSLFKWKWYIAHSWLFDQRRRETGYFLVVDHLAESLRAPNQDLILPVATIEYRLWENTVSNNNWWKEVSKASILCKSTITESYLNKLTGKALPNSESTPSAIPSAEVWSETESDLCKLLSKFHRYVRHHTACLFEIAAVKS